MDSLVIKRSLRIDGDEFNFSIEAHFWICFEEIARVKAVTAERLAQLIVATDTSDNFPSVIRTYVLEYYQKQSKAPENFDPVLPQSASMATPYLWKDDTQPRWLQ